MRRIFFALLVIPGLLGMFGLGASAQTSMQDTDPNCRIDYLDGQLIRCCETYPGHWECAPYK